ncbi:hypothetical protein AVDCRST_MAG82-3512 [uncultured Rubrobacteraceae bacterium]|uniref:Uncharacterized protein n=1 Tax=uncultured Rubrobacteraceae bacterium TaxID=349277 RepID=A0A6J4QPB9_9ACTN|nr:hypothetical protein AVDCRST_MAG82-3512 [uncultured Rubrobacteraceae bacterium]
MEPSEKAKRGPFAAEAALSACLPSLIGGVRARVLPEVVGVFQHFPGRG